MAVIDLMGSGEFVITISPSEEESREVKKESPPPRRRLSIININGEIVDIED